MLEELREEHRKIKRILRLLNLAAARWESGEPVAVDLFVQGAGFLQSYIEEAHHSLEKEILFSALEKDGVSWQGGPLEALRQEHLEGRKYLSDLQAVLERFRRGDAGAKEEIIEDLKAYSLLLKAHMDKEEMVVFPMAERLLQESGEPAEEVSEPVARQVWKDKYAQFVRELERQLQIEPHDGPENEPELCKEPDRLAEEFLRRNR